jgi:hypothetical protein
MPNGNNGNNLKKINLNRYKTDVEGISLDTLETGLWWAKNRKNLKILLIILLAATGILSWGYTLFGFGNYLFFGMNSDDRMMKLFVQTETGGKKYLDQAAPSRISLSQAGYIANGDKYDLYVQAVNPNKRWLVAIDYCFKRANGEKSCGHDFLLPGGKKYILSLAQSFSSIPSDLSFSIDNLIWKKVNNHIIADWSQYQNDRIDFSITNQQFIPAFSNVISEKIALNSLTFTIRNNSAFSYWEVPLTIVLTGNGRIVYLNRYPITDFLSHDTRDIKITWPGAIGEVTGISIAPDLDISDQKIYKQPQ